MNSLLRAAVKAAYLAAWGLAIALPSTPPRAAAAGVHLSLVASPANLSAGDTLLPEATITAPDDSFNAFDLNIAFDSTRLAFVPTTPLSAQRGSLMTNACSNTFHSFTNNASDVRASLSLLCRNIYVAGPGVIYRVKFRALNAPGATSIACSEGSQFYRAGVFADPLDCAAAQIAIMGATAVESGSTDIDRAIAPRISVYPNPCRAGAPAELAMSGAAGEVASIDVLDLSGRLVERVLQASPIGAEMRPPVSASPMSRGVSKPAHTPTTRSGEKPMNHASL